MALSHMVLCPIEDKDAETVEVDHQMWPWSNAGPSTGGLRGAIANATVYCDMGGLHCATN